MAYNDAFDAMWKQIGMIISGFLDGYLMQARSSSSIRTDTCTRTRAENPSGGELHSDMQCVATHGIFKLYEHRRTFDATKEILKSDKAQEKEVNLDMPCQFSDGSFRLVNANNGRLQYRFQFKGGQVAVYGHSKQECWDKRLAFLTNPPDRKPKRKKLTYADWASKWLETYKKNMVESAYYEACLGNFKNHINPIIGDKELKAITPLELQEMLQNIKSDNVRTKCATLVGESFRVAKVCGLIDSNPYEGVKIKRYQQPELGAMTHRQQKALLEYIDNNIPGSEINDFIRILLFTGMRQSELNALRVENVNFESHQITIDSAFKRDTHTTGKTKTKRGRRIIPIAPPLELLLQKYCDADPRERLFHFESQEYTYRKIGEAIRGAGFPFSGHILRHTFITNAYELGFPQYLVQRWVGHAGFEEDNVYLSLRTASTFCETEITKYMYLLKEMTVLH